MRTIVKIRREAKRIVKLAEAMRKQAPASLLLASIVDSASAIIKHTQDKGWE